MAKHNENDTQPSRALNDTNQDSVEGETKPHIPIPVQKRFPLWLIVSAIVLLILVGILSGYGSGMAQRFGAEKTQLSTQLQEQYELGIQKMDAGQYELAKSHFDFIIEHDPKYPGVLEAYTELLLRMQSTPTPVFTPTPTITSTPDLRSADAIYANIRSALIERDWDTVLSNLDSLRKTAPTYRVAEVDGYYYLALRMRGVGKILLQEGETCPDINLEGGIYDLTSAEKFGTLDAVAEGLRTYSRLYIIGASYWDQNWEQAQNIFDQVRAGNPNLRDSSCMTATERWRFATIQLAKQLITAGDPCGAEEQFNLAFSITSDRNNEYFPTATKNFVECHGEATEVPPTEEPLPTESPTPIPPAE